MKQSIATYAAWAAFLVILVLADPARAATIGFTYNLTGNAQVVDGTATTLTLDAMATGSIVSNDLALNNAWNPVIYSDESVLDLNTGLLNGTFTIFFADGATLTGTLFEDDSAVLQSPTETGPFPQTLTFTGGTKEFAAATGFASGTGFVGVDEFSVSGAGTLNAPAVP